jgi:hypothetical protein
MGEKRGGKGEREWGRVRDRNNDTDRQRGKMTDKGWTGEEERKEARCKKEREIPRGRESKKVRGRERGTCERRRDTGRGEEEDKEETERRRGISDESLHICTCLHSNLKGNPGDFCSEFNVNLRTNLSTWPVSLYTSMPVHFPV